MGAFESFQSLTFGLVYTQKSDRKGNVDDTIHYFENTVI